MKLLIVDDEKPIVSALRSYFETKGYSVDAATEREEAEALLVHGAYACVILDLKLTPLSNSDGLEIVRVCHESNPSTRIIVLSAYGTPELEAEAKARGADAFAKKPQALADLAQLVHALTGVAA